MSITESPQYFDLNYIKEHVQGLTMRQTRHIVGYKRVNSPGWIMNRQLIKAKEDYDAGTHEMCQARREVHGIGECFILLSIPRKRVDVGREPYFSMGETA